MVNATQIPPTFANTTSRFLILSAVSLLHGSFLPNTRRDINVFYAKEVIKIASGSNGATTIHSFVSKKLRDLFVERRREYIDKASNTHTERQDISEAEAKVLIEKHGRSALVKHTFV